ncbi:MAG: hypothetical protein RLZZ387_2894 [Chloroflexota bacterium]
MIGFFKSTVLPLGQRAFAKFQQDECANLGASLAYYALFSLFPLLLVILSIVGFVAGPASDARATILRLAADTLPSNAYSVIEETLASLTENRGSVGLIGFGTLLLSASGFFGALDKTFDKIWSVAPPPNAGAGFLSKALTAGREKAVSFALVLGAVLLVILSVVANLVIQVLFVTARDLTDGIAIISVDDAWILQVVQLVVSLVVLFGVLAVLYRMLPSTYVAWGDVWLGALLAALVFIALQRLVVGGVVNLGASYQGYGVIGGVMLLMFWIYLSSQVLLLGAELCYAYATMLGSRRGQPAHEAVPATAAAGEATPADERAHGEAARVEERMARAAGAGVLVGALGTATLGVTALVIGVGRALRALRRE